LNRSTLDFFLGGTLAFKSLRAAKNHCPIISVVYGVA
jgi:hypothetical protein